MNEKQPKPEIDLVNILVNAMAFGKNKRKNDSKM
jgi:hypothetical protein